VPGAAPNVKAVISNGGTALVNAGSNAIFSGSLDIGGPAGHGSLIVDGGALLRQYDSVSVLGSANISGSVVVSDNGSFWGLNDAINLSGSGTFTVENGATVSSGLDLGAQNDLEGNGVATVTGAGSTWSAGGLKVGGASALRIYDHALVQADSLRVANTASVEVNNGDTAAAGLVVAGSFENPGGALGNLTVGNTANGRMDIIDGGGVVNSIGTIGRGAGRTAVVTVDGYGSRWDNSSDVVVGESGVGTLTIQHGAAVTSLRGHLGFNPGASGAVIVAGSDSTWTASGSLFIGNGGNGSLQVQDHGLVSTAGNSYLGFSVGASGSAIVQDAGSTWNTAGTLIVGGNFAASGGSGNLSIQNHGAVNAGAIILYSTGQINLTNQVTLTGPITSYGGQIRVNSSDSVLNNEITLQSGGLDVRTFGNNLTLSGNLSGTGGLTKDGGGFGTLTLTGNNTYTGPTTISSGKLVVQGSITSPLTLENGAILDGSGSVGEVIVKDGGVVAPGNSPGLLTTGNATFKAGGAYLLDLRSDGAGAAGTDWDSLAVNGTLDVSAISETNPFMIRLQTLDASNHPNYLDLWDRNVSHTWNSVLTTVALSGGDFDARSFEVDTTGFQNPINGTFSMVQDGTNFNLQYDATVPEPSSWTGTNSSNWADSGNWSSAIPGAATGTSNTDTAAFNQNAPNSPLTIDPGWNVKNITFDTAGVNSLTIGTIGGNPLLLTAGGMIQSTSTVVNPQTVNAPLVLEGDYTFISGAISSSATLSFGGGITPGATSGITTLTLDGDNTGANTINGVLADNGSAQLAVTKSGSGVWILSGANTYSGDTTVLGGTLKFNITSGTPTIATGVTATVASGATLELAGSVSALGTTGGNRVHVVNNSTSSGVVVSGTNQVVGAIDGSGTTQVNAGSDLTADHIIQDALTIGGAEGSPGLVTIDTSDASGNPLVQLSGFDLANSLTPIGLLKAGEASSANLGSGDGTDLSVPAAGDSVGIGNGSQVPEPPTLALALVAVLGIVSIQFARHHFRCQTL
jgi:fibronectin-binding autotransporter adhesin